MVEDVADPCQVYILDACPEGVFQAFQCVTLALTLVLLSYRETRTHFMCLKHFFQTFILSQWCPQLSWSNSFSYIEKRIVSVLSKFHLCWQSCFFFHFSKSYLVLPRCKWQGLFLISSMDLLSLVCVALRYSKALTSFSCCAFMKTSTYVIPVFALFYYFTCLLFISSLYLQNSWFFFFFHFFLSSDQCLTRFSNIRSPMGIVNLKFLKSDFIEVLFVL